MSLLPLHWKYLSRSIHFRTITRWTILHCVLTGRISPSPTWQGLSLGSRLWPPTSIRVHPGKTEKGFSQWSPHHLLCGLSLPTYAQHPCQTHLPTHPFCLSPSFRNWRRLYLTVHPARSTCRCRPHSGQPRFGRLFYQYWSRQIRPLLVHAPGLPPSKDECLRRWSLLRLSGQIQQSRWHHQRTYLSSSQCHSEDGHQTYSWLDQVGPEHADLCPGQTMCPPMPRKSHGESSLPSSLPYGRFHQWTNLVLYLSPNPRQPSSVHPTHPLCWQSSDLWRQTPHRPCTIWSSSWRWLLWQTHHPRDWTWPRIPWVYARNKTLGADISRTNQHLSSPFPLFSLSSSRPTQWFPLTLPHRHQGCLPSFSCSTRFDPINSSVHPRGVSQGGAPVHLGPTFDSASEPSITALNKGFLLAGLLVVLLWLGLLSSFLLGLLLLLFLRFVFRLFLFFGSFLAQLSLAPFFSLGHSLRWIMLKVVLSITIWLGLWCIWTIWQDFFLSSSPPLNGRTQCLLKISVLNAQHQGISTLSFLYPHRQCHPHWWLTGAFRHAWWKILTQTSVPPPCILHLFWNGNIRPPTLLAFTTPLTCRILTQLRETQWFLSLVEENLGPQSQSRFAPSKGSPRQSTRNPRRNRNCPLLRQRPCQRSRKKPLLVRFQLPQKLLPMLSTLTTLMEMLHQQQLPLTTLKSTRAIVESPRPILPFLRVLLPLRWHQIPKHQHLPLIEFFSQILWTHLGLHHSVPGPTQMIKNWRAWNRTQSPVLRGRPSVQDFIVTPRYANWDGASWNKRLGFLTNTVMTTHPSNPRQKRRTNKQYCTVRKKTWAYLRGLLTGFLLVFLSSSSFPVVCLFHFLFPVILS